MHPTRFCISSYLLVCRLPVLHDLHRIAVCVPVRSEVADLSSVRHPQSTTREVAHMLPSNISSLRPILTFITERLLVYGCTAGPVRYAHITPFMAAIYQVGDCTYINSVLYSIMNYRNLCKHCFIVADMPLVSSLTDWASREGQFHASGCALVS